MTKRAHEIASRQAEVARERKRKKKLQLSRPASSDAATKVMSEAGDTSSSAADSVMGSVSAQPAGPIKVEDMQNRYVKRDLRLIAIVGVPLIVVLIVLAFVL